MALRQTDMFEALRDLVHVPAGLVCLADYRPLPALVASDVLVVQCPHDRGLVAS